MEANSRFYYELMFYKEYNEAKGVAFQDLFSLIMETGFPGDFQRVVPWGPIGDLKCDGFLRSERMIFQVYAPRTMSDQKTLKKLDKDVEGALLHWSSHFDQWTLVHNDRDGLSATITRRMLDLEAAHNPKRFRPWGPAELQDRLFKFPIERIATVLGPPLTSAAMSDVRMDDIRLVVENMARLPPPASEDLRPVNPKKLEINRLSANTASLLRAGRLKSGLVQKLFQGWPDAEFGDRVAEAFRTQYQELKNQGLEPDIIYMELHKSVVPPAPTSAQLAASFAILTHLFDYCDIFERENVHDTAD